MTFKNFSNTRRTALKCIGATMALAATDVRAQSKWAPGRPVRIVVPFAPGGGADTSARLVAQRMGERLGQTVIVENRSGASGAIGTDYVYNAPPDGTVLMAATGDAQAVAPHVMRMHSETLKFVPLAGITRAGFVLMSRKNLPAANLKELIALGRKQSLTYSSAGTGSAINVVTAALAQILELRSPLEIPYQGGGPAILALLAGEVDLMMVPGSIAGTHLSKLKAYGYTSDKRSRFLSAIPTLAEQGYPLTADSWTGIVAPPGTPSRIADVLSRAIYETVNDPAMQAQFEQQNRESFQLNRNQFADYYKHEYESWGRMAAQAGIKRQ